MRMESLEGNQGHLVSYVMIMDPFRWFTSDGQDGDSNEVDYWPKERCVREHKRERTHRG